MFALNYDGLKKRDTYDEIIDYLQNKQEKIKYPNRLAKQVRNTPQLSNLLDGDGEDIENINDQQTDKIILAKREQIIKQSAMRNNQTERVLKVDSQTTTIPENFEIYTQTEDDGDSAGDSAGDIIEAYGNDQKEQEKAKSRKDAITKRAVMHALHATGQLGGGILHLVARATVGVAQGSMAVAQGSMALASGVASSSLFTGNGGDSDEEDVNTLSYAPSQATTGVVYGSSNDDLNSMKVAELRPLLRKMDYVSLGINSNQIKGQGEGKLGKKGLVEAIKKLRSR